MTELTPTAAERATERFGAAALQRAVAALRADGFVGATRKGAVLIRDMRLWHRGTPNRSAETRFMVAMIHTVAWYRRSVRVELEQACAPVFAGCAIENAIPLVANPKDHLTGNAPYEYAGPN